MPLKFRHIIMELLSELTGSIPASCIGIPEDDSVFLLPSDELLESKSCFLNGLTMGIIGLCTKASCFERSSNSPPLSSILLIGPASKIPGVNYLTSYLLSDKNPTMKRL